MPAKTPNPFVVQKPSFLWRLATPTTSGTLVAAVAASYQNLTGKSLNLPYVENLPVISAVPSRVYLALIGFLFGYGTAKGCNWLRWRIIKSLFTYCGWVVSPKSFKTKAWALLLKMLEGPPPHSTFMFQPYLPKQPLPDLNETLDRWLYVSSYILTKDEFEMTKEAVEEFRNNEGPMLQAYLQEKSNKEDNWIYYYWKNVVYLASRQPLPVHSNYYICYSVGEHRATDPLVRAAVLTHLFAKFERMLEEDKLPPVVLQGLVPLCMDGFRYIFNTCRIPGEYKDDIVRCPGKSHLIVLRKGKYYKIDVHHKDKKRTLLTAEEIKSQLQKIVAMADADEETELPVAALTGQKRDVWARQRIQLLEKNKKTFEDIESCMFILALDDTKPKDYADSAKQLLTGNLNNRWFDKCFTFIVNDNAMSGANIEHSVLDAMVCTTLMEYSMVYERYENGDVPKDPKHKPRPLKQPERLTWDLSGMEDNIHKASSDLTEMIDDLELEVFHAKYGKGFMKKQRISPDGYIQMAYQLAYYKLHKEFVKTYEPSTGRLFLLGRTETVNPVSAMSVAWINAMHNPESTWQTRKELLKRAVNYQTKYRLEATIGKGCDRHLLALLCASREQGMDIPKMFMDKAWQLPYKLSTSQTPCKSHDYGADFILKSSCGGFGPACEDGYGICYVVFGDDVLSFHITTFKRCSKTSAVKLGQAIHEAMDEMKELLSR